jgi:hypothetical protein
MTVVTADEDSGVEMSHPRADNGKFNVLLERWRPNYFFFCRAC